MLPDRPVEDVIWTWESHCLLTERAVDVFRRAGLTGYTLKPGRARFAGQPEREAPKVWELLVTGWGGMARPESGMHLSKKQYCEGCGHLHLRYEGPCEPTCMIDEGQWDGSDFFFVWPLPLYRFVSERAASVIRQAKITDVELRSPEETKPIDSASPGSISFWLPEPRAREIGEPLGIYCPEGIVSLIWKSQDEE